MLPALLATLLFSISSVAGSRNARVLGGTEANYWRLMVALGLLAIYSHGWGQGLSGAAFPIFFISGIIGYGFGDVALYQALPRLGTRLAVLMVHCLAAPFAALTEWLWLGTRLSPAQIISGSIILGGVMVALLPDKKSPPRGSSPKSGVIFGLIAAMGQGAGAVLSRRAYAEAAIAGEYIDGLTAAYQRIIGGCLLYTI